MIKRAFVFPGQGSQHVGMGATVVADWKTARDVLTRLEDMIGKSVVDAMLNGPESRLRRTDLAQVAVFGLSVALTRVLGRCNVEPTVVAGHSLGEFSALVAAGWLDFDAAAEIVAHRANAMAACCRRRPGAMSAVMGVDPAVLRSLLAADETSHGQTVVAANFNAPDRTVISGDAAAVERVERVISTEALGAAQSLSVDGAFHSPLMRPAEDEMVPMIARLPLREGHTPLISSITGDLVHDVESYRAALARQITAPVRWAEAVRVLLAHRVDQIVEVGPGKALLGLIRKVDRHQQLKTCAQSSEIHALSGSLDSAPA